MRRQRGPHTPLDSALSILSLLKRKEGLRLRVCLCPSGQSNLETASQRIFQKLGPRMGTGFTAPQVTCTSNPVVTLEGNHIVRFVVVNSQKRSGSRMSLINVKCK